MARSLLRTLVPLAALGLTACATSGQPQPEGTRSAYVQGSLNLVAGERLTLRRLGDGGFEVAGGARIEVEDVLPPAEGTPVGPRGLAATELGTVSFALHARQDVGSLLRIENGTNHGLKYIAFIRRVSGGQVTEPARTSTCTVPAGKVSFEHWQEPVVQVVAGSFEDVEGDMPVCESHDVNE